MNKAINFTSLILVLITGACQKDDLTMQESKINQLTSAPWKAVSVESATDGDLTIQYIGFSMSFLKNKQAGFNGEYYVQHGGVVFKDTFGKWKFNDDQTVIQFDNGLELETTLSENQLSITVFVEPPLGGRVNGLSGKFSFVLKH
jgi:hypothetical protein